MIVLKLRFTSIVFFSISGLWSQAILLLYRNQEILELYIMVSYIGLLSSSIQIRNPANKWRPSKIGLTLGQRQRRWSIINPALDRRLVFSGKIQSSEQKRLTRIWIVIGDDPPMAQHCANIGLIYRGFSIEFSILYLVLVQNIQLSQLRHEILVLPSKHEHSLKAASMLAHRLRRWPNIGIALGECLVFAGIGQFNASPSSVMLAQH